MKIAIIGWGSLVWDPRELPREGIWSEDGPDLPIEFSRVSRDARLTLVIDDKNGTLIKAMHVPSSRTALSDAIEDLRRREGTSDKGIGWVDLLRGMNSKTDYPNQVAIHDAVRMWCQEKGYDGAVWTALVSNFKKETEIAFSVDAAIDYLRNLPKNVRAEALRYIHNAPICVVTAIRQRAIKEFGTQGG